MTERKIERPSKRWDEKVEAVFVVALVVGFDLVLLVVMALDCAGVV